ncbi:protein BCCIP homolog [Tubulanus polymorphus]|uniref:protein BCCIP homolog n=1 Tax=Tubulanus polymorphus TaxID=672921 RepID=UPI003DA4C94F
MIANRFHIYKNKMAAPRKKRAVEDEMKKLENEETNDPDVEENDSEDDDESENSDDEMLEKEIQIDFEARTADDSDFHGIRRLLQQLFIKANIDLTEMSDMIIAQNYVGSIIKQCELSEEEDDEDISDSNEVFGVISVINVTVKKDADFVKQMVSTLTERCNDCNKRDQFKNYFSDSRQCLGFLINERFINIPPQIALPSFQALKKEIEKANQKKMKFEFKNFLMISKTNVLKDTKSKMKKKDESLELIFQNAEEELFFQEAIFNFSYCVNSEKDTAVGGDWDDEDEEFDSYRTVMIIPADRLDSIINQMVEILA